MIMRFVFILLMLVLSCAFVFVVSRCMNMRLVKAKPFVAKCDRNIETGSRVILILVASLLLACLYFLSIGPVIYLFDALVGDSQNGAGAAIEAVFKIIYKPLNMLSNNWDAFDDHVLTPYILIWWQPPFQLGA